MMTNTRFSMLKASVLRKASLEFVQRQICLIVHLLSIRTTTSITQSGCVSVSMKLFNAIEKILLDKKTYYEYDCRWYFWCVEYILEKLDEAVANQGYK